MTCADWITVILREWGISRHTHRGMLHTLIDSCLDRTLNGTQRWGVLGIALDSQRNTHHPMERTGSRANLSRARAVVQCPKSCVHLSKLMRARGRVKVDFFVLLFYYCWSCFVVPFPLCLVRFDGAFVCLYIAIKYTMQIEDGKKRTCGDK